VNPRLTRRQAGALALSPAATLFGASSLAAGGTFSAVATGGSRNLTLEVSIGIAEADRGQSGRYYVAAAFNGELFFFDGSRWRPWRLGPMPSLAAGPLVDRKFVVAANVDMAGLHGAAVFAGYGSSDADLVSRANYALVHTLAPRYDVGVDYHAHGSDFLKTAFVTIYHQPEVRAAVRQQLQGIADAGATIVSTRLWFVADASEGNLGETFRTMFPITAQEVLNLRQYLTDVAAIVGAHGQRLRVHLVMLYLGWAGYTTGSPATGLGFFSNVPGPEYTRRWTLCLDGVLAAAAGVRRSDGVPVVDRIYMDGEVMVGAKKNQDWFLRTHYPTFVARTRAAGFVPTLYFLVSEPAAHVLDTAWRDVDYPDLAGYRTMFWVYRSLRFLRQEGLPMPDRIDFSLYITDLPTLPVDTTAFTALVRRVLEGCEAALTPLGAPQAYGIAETFYFTDPARRQAYGRALAAEGRSNDKLQLVSFWTTPDGGGAGIHPAFPFAIADFLPQA
jgi:hypothetical protein